MFESPSVKCGFCDSTFKSKKGLRKHERTHSSEKPHKCDMCDYRAAERYNVTAHQAPKGSIFSFFLLLYRSRIMLLWSQSLKE